MQLARVTYEASVKNFKPCSLPMMKMAYQVLAPKRLVRSNPRQQFRQKKAKKTGVRMVGKGLGT
jgi:hypothetical protein